MNMHQYLAFHRQLKNVPLSSVAEREITVRSLADQVAGGGASSTSFYKQAYVEETVTLTAAASANLTTQLPANARVLFASAKLVGAMALTTAVKLGVGVAGTPSAFLLTGVTMADGTKYDNVVADQAAARTTAATTIVLSTVDAAGAAAGTGTGKAKVRVIYEYITSQPT